MEDRAMVGYTDISLQERIDRLKAINHAKLHYACKKVEDYQELVLENEKMFFLMIKNVPDGFTIEDYKFVDCNNNCNILFTIHNENVNFYVAIWPTYTAINGEEFYPFDLDAMRDFLAKKMLEVQECL
jgi:hypothetical protein